MKKAPQDIPVHKMNDHSSFGMSLKYIDGATDIQDPHVMQAHRDDHYNFVLQQRGTSIFMVDFQEITISETAVYCIMPGQVHALKSAKEISGFFLAIDTSLVDEQFRNVFEDEVLSLQPISIDPFSVAHLERCMLSLLHILEAEDSFQLKAIYEHLATACIGIIAEVFLKSEQKNYNVNARTSVVTRMFKKLLKEEFKSNKSPAQYASALNISLSYLNECVKVRTGMPVGAWIQHEILIEAKRLLYYSSLSVKEIAYALGYDDPTYLSRIFTNAVGVSPGQFRKRYRE